MNRYALPSDTVLLNEYRIDRVLGHGGFGITYLGHNKSLNTQVAIKEYFPSEFAYREDTATIRSLQTSTDKVFAWGRQRFLEEAQTLGKFRHPNIVRVLSIFEANNTAYMVLDYEDGASLADWRARLGRPPTQAEIDGLLQPLLGALEQVHAVSFLHRDIAPDNIIVRQDGTPVLIDFGSARHAIGRQSPLMSAIVKTGYSPPEQYSSDAAKQGAWSDIYAMAATVSWLLTGQRPTDATARMLGDETSPLRSVVQEIGYRSGFFDAIDWGMAARPEHRPQAIADWRSRLFAPTVSMPAPLLASRGETGGKQTGTLTDPAAAATASDWTRDGSAATQHPLASPSAFPVAAAQRTATPAPPSAAALDDVSSDDRADLRRQNVARTRSRVMTVAGVLIAGGLVFAVLRLFGDAATSVRTPAPVAVTPAAAPAVVPAISSPTGNRIPGPVVLPPLPRTEPLATVAPPSSSPARIDPTAVAAPPAPAPRQPPASPDATPPPAVTVPAVAAPRPSIEAPSPARQVQDARPDVQPRPATPLDRRARLARCAEINERAQLGDLTDDDRDFLKSSCR